MKIKGIVHLCDVCKKRISEEAANCGTGRTKCGDDTTPFPEAGKCCVCGKLLCSKCFVVVQGENSYEDVEMMGHYTRTYFHWSFYCHDDWQVLKAKLEKEREIIRKKEFRAKKKAEKQRITAISELKHKLNLSDDELKLLGELLKES